MFWYPKNSMKVKFYPYSKFFAFQLKIVKIFFLSPNFLDHLTILSCYESWREKIKGKNHSAVVETRAVLVPGVNQTVSRVRGVGYPVLRLGWGGVKLGDYFGWVKWALLSKLFEIICSHKFTSIYITYEMRGGYISMDDNLIEVCIRKTTPFAFRCPTSK